MMSLYKYSLFQDLEYAENPLERENLQERSSVSEVKPLKQVYNNLKAKYKTIDLVRVPVEEDCAPKEACFDILVDSLKQEPASTQCVFSCQAGMGRTTLGLILSYKKMFHLFFSRNDNCMPSKRNSNLHRAEENG